MLFNETFNCYGHVGSEGVEHCSNNDELRGKACPVPLCPSHVPKGHTFFRRGISATDLVSYGTVLLTATANIPLRSRLLRKLPLFQ
jgi:hypothetical protein